MPDELTPLTAADGSDPAILTIITVTYNSRGEVGPCIESLPLELCGRPVEAIVVDNASMDGTLEFIHSKYPHVAGYTSGGNLGFGTANNFGVRRSTGEYLLFLNPDARVNKEALEHCLTRLKNEPDIGIISPKLVLANGEMDLACRRAVPTVWDGVTRSTGLSRVFPNVKWCAGYNLTYLPDNDTYPVGAVNGAFMMMRSSLFKQIGAFDERFFMYGEDLDLCLRCSKEGFKVVYDGRHTVIHLKGSSSRKVYRKMSKALFTGTKQFYLKHFNPHNSLIVRWKYDALFWLWGAFSATVGAIRGHKAARPL
jgi:GT2 family glycosyltransferase